MRAQGFVVRSREAGPRTVRAGRAQTYGWPRREARLVQFPVTSPTRRAVPTFEPLRGVSRLPRGPRRPPLQARPGRRRVSLSFGRRGHFPVMSGTRRKVRGLELLRAATFTSLFTPFVSPALAPVATQAPGSLALSFRDLFSCRHAPPPRPPRRSRASPAATTCTCCADARRVVAFTGLVLVGLPLWQSHGRRHCAVCDQVGHERVVGRAAPACPLSCVRSTWGESSAPELD
jgi:hypothetical protein